MYDTGSIVSSGLKVLSNFLFLHFGSEAKVLAESVLFTTADASAVIAVFTVCLILPQNKT